MTAKSVTTSASNELRSLEDKLSFDSNNTPTEGIKQQLIKQLSPSKSTELRSLADQLAIVLQQLSGVNLNVCYEAVAKGKEFYETCLSHPATLVKLAETANILNSFQHCFPSDDEYFFTAKPYVTEEDEYNY